LLVNSARQLCSSTLLVNSSWQHKCHRGDGLAVVLHFETAIWILANGEIEIAVIPVLPQMALRDGSSNRELLAHALIFLFLRAGRKVLVRDRERMESVHQCLASRLTTHEDPGEGNEHLETDTIASLQAWLGCSMHGT
jgi:hypothetical protein